MPELRRGVPFPDQYGCGNLHGTDPFLTLLSEHGDIWNWNVPIGGFHIKFFHQGTWAIPGNHANNLINLNILERKILGINAVIHTSTPRGRQNDYFGPS